MDKVKMVHGLNLLAGIGLLLAASGTGICRAESITISGRVVDTGGTAVTEAYVTLRSTGIGAHTDTDGAFSLEKSATSVIAPDCHGAVAKNGYILMRGGKLRVQTMDRARTLSIQAYGINGRLLFRQKHNLVPGENIFSLPESGSNLHIFRITLGNNHVTVKHIPAIHSASGNVAASPSNGKLLHRTGKVTEIAPDIIDVVKEGMLDYHTKVFGRDTSGIIITMLPSAGTVTDADGNQYQSVRIGNQVWTVENLKTGKYNDGSSINCITDNLAWARCTTGAYCSYNNSAAHAATFGLLYNWYSVETGKLAPEGWRIPFASDWDTLKTALTLQMVGYTVFKSSPMAARTHWTPATGVSVPGNITDSTNISGFCAVPGGIRDIDGSFYWLDTNANWWTATPDTAQPVGALGRRLIYCYNYLWEGSFYKRCGSSIRLVRDE